MANLNVKYQELEALSRFSDTPVPEFSSYLDAQDFKLKLAREIKRNWLSKTPTVTNMTEKRLILENYNVHYKYQREGIYSSLGIEHYFDFKPTSQNEFTFTSSGQAANGSILFTLNRCYNLEFLSESTMWYYETKLLMGSMAFDQNKSKKSILFLDSSKSFDFSGLKTVDYDFAIIDSTCLPIGSDELNDLFRLVDSLRKPIFLTRSHLKLDSFGTDYGNLGSICCFHTDQVLDFQESLIFKRYTDYDPFFNLLVETGTLLGCGMNVDQFYPFLGDSNIRQLNLKRVSRMRNNHDKLLSMLDFDSENCFYTPTPHKLFFFIKYNYPVKMDPELYLKLNQVYGLNGKFCDSFGFDFMTHGNLIKYETGDEFTVIRITCPDYSEQDLEKAGLLLNKYFRTLFQLD